MTQPTNRSYKISSTVATPVVVGAWFPSIAITAAGATGGTLTLKGKIPGQPAFTDIATANTIDLATGEPLFIVDQPVQELEITPSGVTGAGATLDLNVTFYD